MSEYWERLAEAQRVRQEIEAEFVRVMAEARKAVPLQATGAGAGGPAPVPWPGRPAAGAPPRIG